MRIKGIVLLVTLLVGALASAAKLPSKGLEVPVAPVLTGPIVAAADPGVPTTVTPVV